MLAVIQDNIFGGAGLFFNVIALVGERRFVGQEHAVSLVQRPGILLLGAVVASDWIATIKPFVTALGETFESVQLAVPAYVLRPGAAGMVQAAAATLFVALSGWGMAALLRQAGAEGGLSDAARATVCAAGAALAAFLALHLIYGSEVFLYVAHMLPLIAVLIGAALSCANSTLFRAAMLLLIVLNAPHNIPAAIEANLHAAAVSS